MKRNKSKLRVACLAGLSISMMSSMAIQAQETDAATPEEEQQVLDKVTVTGVQNDDAMAAFRAGDYVTAEVEFLDNARCALRIERNRIAGIESIRNSQTQSELSALAGGTSTSVSSDGTVSVDSSSAAQGLNSVSSAGAINKERKSDRTCENRGFQVYMAGLSQIQRGKVDEALDSFERATVLSKTLYDAHYKIGLIKLLQGDEKAAARQLKKVEGILKRCPDCEAKQEIVDRIAHLEKALNGEVSLN